MTAGRPQRKAKLSAFRLHPDAHKNMARICAAWGWTKTMAVERSLAFAACNREFFVMPHTLSPAVPADSRKLNCGKPQTAGRGRKPLAVPAGFPSKP